jgi:hypothetical protein
MKKINDPPERMWLIVRFWKDEAYIKKTYFSEKEFIKALEQIERHPSYGEELTIKIYKADNFRELNPITDMP